ncbi:C1q-like domain-containing protein [Cytobacillus sp. Hm23]
MDQPLDFNEVNRISFNNAIINNGNGYDTSANQFKAPETGFYIFTTEILLEFVNPGNIEIEIRSNKRLIGSTGVLLSFQDEPVGFTAMTPLDADELVAVFITPANTGFKAIESAFTYFGSSILR